ncbi:hypothetical protein DPEC_G00296580 [Dallia pectoralis]|uniref:Uncharacterized protein n=1 Tax=Dallia pectoralis TaxID=75939 RepID=A0ACC2FFN5_DALPE|nr:hypothetical protein DPEC_G00296580 [Dallia pectoralis]
MTTVEMKVIKESSLRQDYENVRKQHIRATSAQTSGRRVYIWVAVGFGILCVSQVILNVYLRLVTYSTSEDNHLETSNTTQTKTCPQGWILTFGRSCYFTSPDYKNWTASRQDCLDRGADLVIINSREEQAFIKALNHIAWIGLTENEVEGTWRWVDGTLLTTSYWKEHEPNGGTNENCTEITGFHNDPILAWNDLLCDSMLHWICERS